MCVVEYGGSKPALPGPDPAIAADPGPVTGHPVLQTDLTPDHGPAATMTEWAANVIAT